MGGCCGKDEKSDFDPRNNGPIKNRSCTDVICCAIFFATIVGFVIVGLFAWLNGNPVILLQPTDNQGRICGVKYGDLDLSNKTNLFFFDLTKCASPSSYLQFQCATTQTSCDKSCEVEYHETVHGKEWTQCLLACTAMFQGLNIKFKNNYSIGVEWMDIHLYQGILTLLMWKCMICVNSCPNTTWTYLQDMAILNAVALTLSGSPTNAAIAASASSVDWSVYLCDYGIDARVEFEKGTNGASDLNALITSQKCAPYFVPMDPLVGRCIPSVLADATEYEVETSDGNFVIEDADNNTVTGVNLEAGSTIVQAYLNAQEIAMKLFADFTTSWYWILAGLGIAALISFLWIVIMRWIAGIMVWITIFGIFGVLGFGIYYTYTQWQSLPLTSDTTVNLTITSAFQTDLSQYLALRETWLAFFIILCVVGGIFLLLILFLRKRILIAVAVIKEASKAVASMISTLFYPLVTFILSVIVIAFWAATALFMASSGDPVYRVLDTDAARVAAEVTPLNNTNCNVTEWSEASHQYVNDPTIKCMFIEYGGDSVFHQNTLWLQIACVIALFWLVNWVIALGQCTLAGAYASYYWAFDKSKDVPALPLFSAFARSLRYHTGSLAFGSFIITLIQIIRVILEYFDHKLRGSENKVAKFFMCICKCCCWCLEKFMKFLNKNAYIMIAVYGKNFCWSAKEALKLLIKNVLRAVVIDKVTDFLLFIGKLIVTAGLVALSWAFFGNKISLTSSLTPSLNYYWMPIVIIGIGTYIIASGFFNTYGMAVDTVFLCFLEDLERNDGSEEKPYFMSKGLMGVLGKKNKKPKAEKNDSIKKKKEKD